MTEDEAHAALCAYTLLLGDAAFTHQHVVDAWAAQHADASSTPIAVAFALAGLYLRVERRWSGREIQAAHTRMARDHRPWPALPLPATRGTLGALDVLAAPPDERIAMIDRWCETVWSAWHAVHDRIRALVASIEGPG